MKKDWGYRFNPTMNGRGRSVLIWGKTCRTLLGDKGKPLSGDKGTHTDEHGPKIQKGRMARIQTTIYAYTYGLNCIQVRKNLTECCTQESFRRSGLVPSTKMSLFKIISLRNFIKSESNLQPMHQYLLSNNVWFISTYYISEYCSFKISELSNAFTNNIQSQYQIGKRPYSYKI